MNHDGVRRYGEMGQDGGNVLLGMSGMLGCWFWASYSIEAMRKCFI